MMGIADLTLNIMSLGGLALGTGLLLDNAIVMLENIYRRRETDGLGRRGSGPRRGRGGHERRRRVHHDQPRLGGAVPAHHRPLRAHLPRTDPHDLVRDPGVAAIGADADPDARGTVRQGAVQQRARSLPAAARVRARFRADDRGLPAPGHPRGGRPLGPACRRGRTWRVGVLRGPHVPDRVPAAGR